MADEKGSGYDEIVKDYCGVAEGRCRNPAGFQVGGLGGPTGDNPDGPRTSVTCSWCGTVCCADCRVREGGWVYCLHCHDEPSRRNRRARAALSGRDEQP